MHGTERSATRTASPHTRSETSPDSVFARHLGARFDGLAPELAWFHSRNGTLVLTGIADVERGSSLLAHVLNLLSRLPPTGKLHALRFELRADARTETWTRWYSGVRMRSTLDCDEGLIRERLGPFRLHYRLDVADGSLSMHLERLSMFGLPVPRRFWPKLSATETGEGGRFRFDIRAETAGGALLVRYRGHLELKTVAGIDGKVR